MNNLLSMAMQTVTTMIIGIGFTFVIVAGSIDLSVGPVLAMCSVIVATLLANDQPIWLCCVTWFGLRNGAWINKWSTDYENAASCFCGNDRYADGDSRLGIGIYRFAGGVYF